MRPSEYKDRARALMVADHELVVALEGAGLGRQRVLSASSSPLLGDQLVHDGERIVRERERAAAFGAGGGAAAVSSAERALLLRT